LLLLVILLALIYHHPRILRPALINNPRRDLLVNLLALIYHHPRFLHLFHRPALIKNP